MQRVTAATLFAFLMACLWPYAARAADPPPPQGGVNDEALTQAKTHFEAGRNAYNAQDYITAIREFKAAEALRPSPILAYNIGLANEKLGKRRVALKYYHRYLEQMPNAQNRPEVEGRIQQLEAEAAAAPQPPPPGQPPPPQAVSEQPGDNPPPPQQVQPGYDPYASNAQPVQPGTPQKRKSYWWVWLLVAGGAALVIAVVVAVAVVYGDSSTYYYYDHALMTNPRDPASSSSRTPGTTLPILHF